MDPLDVSVVIPTYRREQVLLDTLMALSRQAASEILVVDQTPQHTPAVEEALACLDTRGTIRWRRLPQPSIPRAMNEGLRQARRDIVLFLDDDILPGAGLLEAHARAYTPGTVAVAGQVLRPGQSSSPPRAYQSSGFAADLDFPFESNVAAWITNGMAGNLSVMRDAARAVGGFDENFIGAAYRFETEFCRRLARRGRIRYEPTASIRHLQSPTGGIRSFGDHRRSASPAHAVGDYYFALGQRPLSAALAYVARRPLRCVATRFHLRRPWWIPVKLAGELGGLVLAAALWIRGPRLLEAGSR
jgi:GT2 family glycosyltransferase